MPPLEYSGVRCKPHNRAEAANAMFALYFGSTMFEYHNREQYFFDSATIAYLSEFASQFENVCCLCAPLLGKELAARGIKAHVLDIDERFANLPGFRHYDIHKPRWLGEEFGLILCDPPFFGISLTQLFKAIRLLSRHDYNQPLLLCYLTRRAANVTRTFARFNLQPTGFHPTYQTVQNVARNDTEFFGNLGFEQHQKLCRTPESNL